MTEKERKEIVGYRNIDMGHIFCLRCFSEYVRMNSIPERIKEEFNPISTDDKWVIGPSCTQCSKKII